MFFVCKKKKKNIHYVCILKKKIDNWAQHQNMEQTWAMRQLLNQTAAGQQIFFET